jgi:hypothetical protein
VLNVMSCLGHQHGALPSGSCAGHKSDRPAGMRRPGARRCGAAGSTDWTAPGSVDG